MSFVTDPNLGWNAGARSVVQCVGDCLATFSVTAPALGVVCGFNTLKTGPDFRGIQHALYFSRAGVAVMESSTVKTAPTPFASSDVFTLRRVGGVVQYLRNAVLFYTSSTPSTGTVFLDASFYSSGDQIT